MATIDVIQDLAAFDALAHEWEALHAGSEADALFASWPWQAAWLHEFGRGRRPHVVVVREAGRMIAIAPLVERAPTLRRLQPGRVLEFMGTGTAGSDYLDFIVRRGAERTAIDALAAYLHDARIVLELSHTDARDSIAARVASRLGDDGWSTVAERVEVCPVVDLAGHDWDSYLATLGSSHRYNVRRRERQLAKAFDVRIECASDERERRLFLADLVRLHRLRRDTLGGSDGLGDATAVAFHERFTAVALARGWLRLTRMTLDGEPVAAVYAIAVGGSHRFYQSGFDPAHARHSVGLVALADSIRRAIGEGAHEYDFLHGDERYKYHWGAADRALVRHHVYPPRIGGFVARQLLGLKRQVRPCRAA